MRKFPEAHPSHGQEEFSEFLARFREAWFRYEWAIRELIAVGKDRVMACLELRAEGRESGMNLEGNLYQCIWLRHGRFIRVEDHLTLSRALHALGLEGDTLEAAGLRAPSNLDLVRSICEAWERGDFSPAKWTHPELEFVIADGPQPGSWTGAVPEGFRTWVNAWEEFRTEADEYRELDDERVFVLKRFSGRGKTSGLKLDELLAKAAHVFHIRDGKVMKVTVYFDRQRAFADLGLPSEAGSKHS